MASITWGTTCSGVTAKLTRPVLNSFQSSTTIPLGKIFQVSSDENKNRLKTVQFENV
jgi:hypothetical protein